MIIYFKSIVAGGLAAMETGLWFALMGGVIGSFLPGRNKESVVIGSLAGLVIYAGLSHQFSLYLVRVLSWMGI